MSTTAHPHTDAYHPMATAMGLRAWLWLIALMVFAMIMVGGATRLTDSGLSITEWQLISGIVPPLSEAAWERAFAKYREIPEYTIVNAGMSLAEFKAIYWWEWAHRFLGRFIGAAYFIPLAVFWMTGHLSAWLKRRLVLILLLGAAQGGLGWFMVMSGLAGRTDVSQYRLAAHLGLAVLLFALTLWTILDLTPAKVRPGQPRSLEVGAGIVCGLVFVQILLGALVAGLDAGQGYNTWPLIEGKLIPDGLWAATPWPLNLFENALTVQFDHRIGTYVIVIAVLIHAMMTLRHAAPGAALPALLLVAAALAQSSLGIWTLLARVPILLGLAHQAGAVVLFAIALWHWHALRHARQDA